MRPAQKRLVYLGLTAAVILVFVIGLAAGWAGRKAPICKDGRPPVAEQDQGPLGDVLFRCHDGQTVTSYGGG